MDGNDAWGPVAKELKRIGPVLEGSAAKVIGMSEEQIEYTIQKFADAAAFAKNCGFGMVVVHGGHGWLISQFLSPVQNTRTDRWGGSPENRVRFLVEVLDRVRKAVGPGFPIEVNRFDEIGCKKLTRVSIIKIRKYRTANRKYSSEPSPKRLMIWRGKSWKARKEVRDTIPATVSASR